MTRSFRTGPPCLGVVFLAVSIGVAQDPPRRVGAPRVRTVELTYESAVSDVPAGSKLLRAWIPMPRKEDGLQQVISAEVGPIPIPNAKVVEKTDKSGANRYWVIDVPDPPPSLAVKATLRVRRTEQINNDFGRAVGRPLASEDRLKMKDDLAANARVPVSGAIEKMADAVVPAGETNPVKVARRIYDHLVATMEYKKTGSGWGQGDTLWACESRYGNCTDFHSVFMSLGRLRGIPVRFTMGLPLPSDPSGTIGGYHCWADFFVAGLGWVPVDISEAARHKELAEYYFGSLTADRISFTRGRDLELDPPPASGKQNFFIYPIVEVDGSAHAEKHAFTCKDV